MYKHTVERSCAVMQGDDLEYVFGGGPMIMIVGVHARHSLLSNTHPAARSNNASPCTVHQIHFGNPNIAESAPMSECDMP